MPALYTPKPLSVRQAPFYILFCGILWSFSGLCIKLLPWHPAVIAGSRSLIAALVLLAYTSLTGTRIRMTRKSAIGGALVAITIIIFVFSNKLTSSANASVLQYTSPIFIILIELALFRKKPHRRDLLVVGLTVAAMPLFFIGKFGGGKVLGDLLAILSGLAMAGQFISNSRSHSEAESLSSIFIGHLIVAVFAAPFAVTNPPAVTLQSAGIILFLGVFQLGLSYILYSRAILVCPPLQSMLIAMIEPILNPVITFLGIGEVPSVLAVAGAMIVIVSVTWWAVRNVRAAYQESD